MAANRQRFFNGRRAAWTTLLAIGFGAGTLFGPTLATATEKATEQVFVTNTSTDPVPVQQQGTANVNVTNASLAVVAVPIIAGGGAVTKLAPGTHTLSPAAVASALSIHLDAQIGALFLLRNGTVVAAFDGPINSGNPTVVLALARPIEFDEIGCAGIGFCNVSWIGNEPSS